MSAADEYRRMAEQCLRWAREPRPRTSKRPFWRWRPIGANARRRRTEASGWARALSGDDRPGAAGSSGAEQILQLLKPARRRRRIWI